MITPESLQVAVLGPGGVGGLLTALLTRAGGSIVVLAGGETATILAERGLRVESRRFGDFQVGVRSAVLLEYPVDACLITVKSTQLEDALRRVPANLVGQALVVPFLNGIDHVDLLRGIYPSSNVAPATIRVESTRAEAGVIRHTSQLAAVEIATSARSQELVQQLGALLEVAGLNVCLRDDETAMLWDKLCFLAPLALLTTHARANVGVVRTRRREDALSVISEVAAVARAEGASVDTEAVIRLLDSVPETMESSMQRDQAAGLPLELDAIGGAVVRRAARAAVRVPITARLVEELWDRVPKPRH